VATTGGTKRKTKAVVAKAASAKKAVETVPAIIAYKGFSADLKCQGYQFALGETFTHDGPVRACSSGFHACEAPFDVWSYYDLGTDNRFCRVHLTGKTDRHKGDSKIAAETLFVETEITLGEMIRAGVKYEIAGAFAKAKADKDARTPAAATPRGTPAAATTRGTPAAARLREERQQRRLREERQQRLLRDERQQRQLREERQQRRLREEREERQQRQLRDYARNERQQRQTPRGTPAAATPRLREERQQRQLRDERQQRRLREERSDG
jgi:hypothetical protein